MEIPAGYKLPPDAVKSLAVPLILRSEILDARTCEVCPAFDGFIAPADDPVWAGEMGMPAHCNCRFKLVVLFNVRDPENWITPQEQVPDLVSLLGAVLTIEMVEQMKIPVHGDERLKIKPIRIEDIEKVMQPADLLYDLFEEYL